MFAGGSLDGKWSIRPRSPKTQETVGKAYVTRVYGLKLKLVYTSNAVGRRWTPCCLHGAAAKYKKKLTSRHALEVPVSNIELGPVVSDKIFEEKDRFGGWLSSNLFRGGWSWWKALSDKATLRWICGMRNCQHNIQKSFRQKLQGQMCPLIGSETCSDVQFCWKSRLPFGNGIRGVFLFWPWIRNEMVVSRTTGPNLL